MKIDIFIANNLIDSAKQNFEFIKNNLNQVHYIIVPDRFSVTVERQILKSINKKCCFNIIVIPLSRFCNKFTSLTNKKLLTKLQSIMLIKKCILNNKDRLTCFNNSSKTESFSQTIFETIMQLKSCLVTVNDITQDNLSPSLKSKLEDIKIIYNAYEEYLKTDYVDSFNRLNLFCEELYLQTELKNANIHFVYYDSFTPLILKVINALIKHCKSVNFALCSPNNNQPNSYIYPTDTLNCVQLEASSLDLTPTYHYYNSDNSIQNFIRENLYSYNFSKPYVSNNFAPTLASFSSVQEEVEYICSSIIKQVEQNNIRYNNISVACANLEQYSLVFKTYLERYNIPYYIDVSKNLAQTALFNTIKNILN